MVHLRRRPLVLFADSFPTRLTPYDDHYVHVHAATQYNAAPHQTFELGLKALLDGLATNRATTTS